jgi:predicted ATPase
MRLRYFCSQYHRDSPFYPFITHLERAAGFTREDAQQTKIGKLQALMSQLGEHGSEAMALYADLLGLSSENRSSPLPSDPQDRRELILRTMVHQLEELAAQQSVLVIFEDIHWIDSTSLELLGIVFERVPSLPVLFLATFRQEFQPQWAGQPHVTTLTLGRLGAGRRSRWLERSHSAKHYRPSSLNRSLVVRMVYHCSLRS